MATVAPNSKIERFRRLIRNDQIRLGVLAIFIGALGGGTGIAFREAIGLVQTLFFGFSSVSIQMQQGYLPGSSFSPRRSAEFWSV